jgi:nitrite reductase (NADH) small subunit
MTLIKVAQVSQLPPGVMKSFPAGDKQVLIINYEGKYYAIDNKCPHAGGRLSEGKLEGKILSCPNHINSYDITTGRRVPGLKIGSSTEKSLDATVYEIKVEGNSIKVDI